MGAFDSYKREETAALKDGRYRVEIVSAEEAVSQTSGKPMIVFEIRPNKSKIKIKNYLVLNEYFNRNATKIFDSFDIEEGNFNLLTWPGAVGAAYIYTDAQGYLKVRYWINRKNAEKLPPWEGELPERQTISTLNAPEGFTALSDNDDDDVPF